MSLICVELIKVNGLTRATHSLGVNRWQVDCCLPLSHPEMIGSVGRYDVERLIGSGGMGLVFKAYDTELKSPGCGQAARSLPCRYRIGTTKICT